MAKTENLLAIAKNKAKEKLRTVVISEGWDPRVLEAIKMLKKEKVCKFVLVEDKIPIAPEAKKIGLDLADIPVVNPATHRDREKMAAVLYELRKHKDMTQEQARELLKDPQYFACMYAQQGFADGVSGSCICPTAALMRPALQIFGTKKGYKLVSEVSVFYDPKLEKNFFFSDSSLNIDPKPEELAAIALNAAKCVRNFGVAPKVALLSFSTKGSGENPILYPIREALALVQRQDKNVLIDGELQVDAAVNPNSAKRKCPNSPLKGEATVLIFPNLTAGNITTHALLQFSRLEHRFVILMGCGKPVGIMGRGATAEMIAQTVMMTAAQCNMDE